MTLASDQIGRNELQDGSQLALSLVEDSKSRRVGLYQPTDRRPPPLGERFSALAQELAPRFAIDAGLTPLRVSPPRLHDQAAPPKTADPRPVAAEIITAY